MHFAASRGADAPWRERGNGRDQFNRIDGLHEMHLVIRCKGCGSIL
jgi:hypothetical protein